MNGGTTERTVADLIVDLIRRFYCDPARFRTQAMSANEMFGNLDIVLRLALRRPVGPSIAIMRGPVAAAELEREAIFFIRECFFREAATHYEVLGLPKDASADEVRENFRLLMQLIHPDRHTTEDAWPDALPTRANLAYSVLRTPQSRAAYDRQIGASVESIPAASTQQPANAPARPPTAAQQPWRRKRMLTIPVMPEWVTTRVGGFVRQHPAMTAFGSTISACILAIGFVAWSEYEGVTTRVVSVPMDGASAALSAPSPRPAPVAAVATVGPASHLAATAGDSALRAAATPASLAPAQESAEIEAVVATFIASFEAGRADALIELFENEAQLNVQHGRPAIRREYEQLFRQTTSRRMNISLLNVRAIGEHAQAIGELTINSTGRDGRESEQRASMDMELVRQEGRMLITRLMQSPK